MSSLYEEDLYNLGRQFQQKFRPITTAEPKKSNTGLIIAIIAIVLLMLIVIGIVIGVVVSKKKEKNDSTDSQNEEKGALKPADNNIIKKNVATRIR